MQHTTTVPVDREVRTGETGRQTQEFPPRDAELCNCHCFLSSSVTKDPSVFWMCPPSNPFTGSPPSPE